MAISLQYNSFMQCVDCCVAAHAISVAHLTYDMIVARQCQGGHWLARCVCRRSEEQRRELASHRPERQSEHANAGVHTHCRNVLTLYQHPSDRSW